MQFYWVNYDLTVTKIFYSVAALDNIKHFMYNDRNYFTKDDLLNEHFQRRRQLSPIYFYIIIKLYRAYLYIQVKGMSFCAFFDHLNFKEFYI